MGMAVMTTHLTYYPYTRKFYRRYYPYDGPVEGTNEQMEPFY